MNKQFHDKQPPTRRQLAGTTLKDNEKAISRQAASDKQAASQTDDKLSNKLTILIQADSDEKAASPSDSKRTINMQFQDKQPPASRKPSRQTRNI
jgi:hypothetical protein